MFKKKYIPYYLFLLISVLAFYQLIFFMNPPIYDMIDCFYPWRFHVGECLQNGIFPFWNPYQDLGYPIHADPSSGVWYPVVWLIGSTIGYTSYSIVFELVFHVFIAGCGMFSLAKTLGMKRSVAFIAGVSFMLCGVFIGNAQHLPYVIGAAWLPFVLSYYFKMVHHREWKNAIYAGFYLFLMITGGYPAFVIILFYFFATVSIYFLIKSIKDRQRFAFSDMFFRHVTFVLSTLVFSAGMIISVWQVAPFINRIGHFTFEQASYSPFGFKAFMSLVYPFSTVHFHEYFEADTSMINGYFGLFMLLFLIPGFFIKKRIELTILMVFSFFAMSAAVGDALPIRKILYDYFPMMDLFRFPAVFRLFFILPFILIAANYLNSLLLKNKFLKVKHWIIPLSLVFIGLIAMIFYQRSTGYLQLGEFFKNKLFTVDRSTSMAQHIAVQSIIQACFVALLIMVMLVFKSNRIKYPLLTFLICVDLLFAAQLNTPYTAYFHNLTAKEALDRHKDLPKGFPAQKNMTIEEAGKIPSPGHPYWQNMNDFNKQISAEGFNSFSFTSYDDLEYKYPFVFFQMQKNHLLMLSDKLRHDASIEIANQKKKYKPNHVYLNDNDFGVVRTIRMQHLPSDTAVLVNYNANHFVVKTKTTDTQILTIFQKDYTGWKAYVNNENVPIYRSNYNFMTIVLPSGTNTVEFRYKNYYVLAGFIISVLSCLILLVYKLIDMRIQEIRLMKRG